ncbi:hypothetical protein Plhal304r1_c023g0079931 [Plasmopara halstedii]
MVLGELRGKEQHKQLLSMIRRGQSSENESVKYYADFALLHMLQHSISAKVVQEKSEMESLSTKSRDVSEFFISDFIAFYLKSSYCALLHSFHSEHSYRTTLIGFDEKRGIYCWA